MTCNPVPVATTANLMVTEGVSDGVAFGQSCGVACPASTAGSSGTPGRGGGDPGQQMVRHLANHQHGAV